MAKTPLVSQDISLNLSFGKELKNNGTTQLVVSRVE